ncbi:peptidylprolyl isomerase [Bacillus salacetis]|uniref:peptidylprolyl isomerase n=1 Tax=Bacillus salacetis TaxID=2315464 RepID=UPI003BA258D6
MVIRKFATIMIMISVLTACTSSTLSFSEIENVPSSVQDRVYSNLKLQMIEDGEKGFYIIFQSGGVVETDVKTEGDTVTVILDTPSSQKDVKKQNTYYLTTDPIHKEISVLVNGEPVPFDSITGL